MRARGVVTQYNSVFLVLIVVCVAAFINTPTFFAFDNVNTMLRQASALGVVTMGTIFVIATGCVDLSVAATLQMSIGIFMLFVKRLGPDALPWGILASLAFGVAIGVVNGIIVTRYRVQSFLATLFTAAILGGLMRLAIGVTPMGVPPAALVNAIKGSLVGGVSNSVLIFAVVALAALVLLRGTVWGRKVELIGLNPTAAHFAGVDVERTITISFGFNGLLAAFAGIVSAGYIGFADQMSLGSGMEMDALVAAVLGGNFLGGGKASVTGAVGGALAITLIVNIVILFGLDIQYQFIVKGVLLLAVTWAAALFGKR
jgi:ribose/xylose/arabinose/galactoside ABC-type transport system permease subunit